MTGCNKTGVKNAIEAIGQYLIDNSERIAGDFNGMIDFNLEVNFKTNSDEACWPEIKFTNHHYLPFSEELSRKIFEAKEDEINDDNWREHRSEAMNIEDLPCELVRSVKEASDEEIQEILEKKKEDKDGRKII